MQKEKTSAMIKPAAHVPAAGKPPRKGSYMKRAILTVIAVCGFAVMGIVPALASTAPTPNPDPGHVLVTPDRVTHHVVGDHKGIGPNLVMQGANSGTVVTGHSFAGTPNQEYNIFKDTSACNNGLATSTCPFTGATPGEQVVLIKGEANGQLCILGTLTGRFVIGACSGVSGVDYEWHHDFGLINGFVTRNNGNNTTYACSAGGGNAIAQQTFFTTDICAWDVATF